MQCSVAFTDLPTEHHGELQCSVPESVPECVYILGFAKEKKYIEICESWKINNQKIDGEYNDN